MPVTGHSILILTSLYIIYLWLDFLVTHCAHLDHNGVSSCSKQVYDRYKLRSLPHDSRLKSVDFGEATELMGVLQNNIPVHVALLLKDRTTITGFLLPNITLHSPRHVDNRLLEINNITVHPEPVRRLLHSRRPNKVPALRCGNFAERLEWAQNELDWTDKELSM